MAGLFTDTLRRHIKVKPPLYTNQHFIHAPMSKYLSTCTVIYLFQRLSDFQRNTVLCILIVTDMLQAFCQPTWQGQQKVT